MAKKRLDILMLDKGLCETRSQAQGLIMAGKVRVDGQRVDKAGEQIAETAQIELLEGLKYVSRGGLKLEKALQEFQVNPEGFTCLDIGAATGGFTDCLLQNGAAKVYAVDVGYGQLAWKLREDPRVVVMEKTNIRTLSPAMLPGFDEHKLHLAVCDASFISLKKTLPVLSEAGFFSEKTAPQIIALLKPQFEYKDYVDDPGFQGVVRKQAHHEAIITGVVADLLDLMPGWGLAGLGFSPITGPEGNIEYLLWLQKDPENPVSLSPQAVSKLVTESYAAMGHTKRTD